tara:strand:+ start:1859 stop:2467 length:609 start_codon:yes stop_codon:yes gene_type:complete
MPNWCNNTFKLSGPKAKVEGLYKKFKDTNQVLNTMYPMPEELADSEKYPANGDKRPLLQKKYGHDDWYGWCTSNWSTKWDVDSENLEYREEGDTGIIEGWFDSAWSPPTGVYDHFLSENEDCSIQSYYYEGGCDFAGEYCDGNDDCFNPSDYTADQMEDSDNGLIYTINEHFNISESVREWEEEQKTDTERFIVDKEAVNAV